MLGCPEYHLTFFSSIPFAPVKLTIYTLEVEEAKRKETYWNEQRKEHSVLHLIVADTYM